MYIYASTVIRMGEGSMRSVVVLTWVTSSQKTIPSE